MRFLTFENRPIRPKTITWACMVGLSIGIPAVVVAPKFIEAHTASVPQPGTPCVYNGEVGRWQILEVNDDSYVLRNYFLGGDNSLTVPKDQVTINDRWIAEEYRWFSWFD